MLALLKSNPLPWLLLGLLASLAGTGWMAYDTGYGHAKRDQLASQATQEEANRALQEMLATEISKLKIEHKTIYRKAEREIIKEPVYIDCKHSVNGLQLINNALSPKADRVTNNGVPIRLGNAKQ